MAEYDAAKNADAEGGDAAVCFSLSYQHTYIGWHIGYVANGFLWQGGPT